MSELVLLHHDEPMTTSLAIASGVQLQHKNVLELIYKYVDSLSEFGNVGSDILPAGEISRFENANSAFHAAADEANVELETRNSRSSRGRPTEIVYLNEPQATLLITFMRNSEIVRRFKIALVKAFYELRDRMRSQHPHRQFLTGDPSHGADLAVAADRTFRSFLRAGRSAGLPLPAALRVANRQTISRTGMDMLAELDVVPDGPPENSPSKETADPLYVALVEWLAGAGDGPLRLAEILRGAVGIGPEQGAYTRLTGAASRYLRKLGWTMRHERLDGGKPTRYWRRIGAPLIRF